MRKDKNSETSQDGACGQTERRSTKSKKADGPIDLDHALNAPVRVNQDGQVRTMATYEAILRQHVRKALLQKTMTSIKFLLGEAEKHGLIKPPPVPMKGGVFVVPKNLPEDIERAIWEDDDYAQTGTISITRIILLLAKVHTMDRIKRCFNGYRD